MATHVTFLGWVHLALFGVALPLLAVRSARQLSQRTVPLPPRLVFFQSTAAMLLSCCGLSLATALVQHMRLFPPSIPHPWRGLAAGAAMYGIAVGTMRPRWRAAVLRRARAVYFFVAETRTERAWWILVSVIAGIGEEITWRGMQTALLVPVVGHYWIAALLSGISFGVAHAVQGWRSVAVILVFALGFQAVVAASGSLYIAMAVHIAYDITAGFAYGRLARELGYEPAP